MMFSKRPEVAPSPEVDAAVRNAMNAQDRLRHEIRSNGQSYKIADALAVAIASGAKPLVGNSGN